MNKQEFICFLKEFRKNSDKFENNTLESFLQALENYASDLNGYYSNTKQNIDLNEIDWKVLSDLLKGASIYE